MAGTALGPANPHRQTAPRAALEPTSTVDGLFCAGVDSTPGIGVPACSTDGEHAASADIESMT